MVVVLHENDIASERTYWWRMAGVTVYTNNSLHASGVENFSGGHQSGKQMGILLILLTLLMVITTAIRQLGSHPR